MDYSMLENPENEDDPTGLEEISRFAVKGLFSKFSTHISEV
jgi:hypothetical protein